MCQKVAVPERTHVFFRQCQCRFPEFPKRSFTIASEQLLFSRNGLISESRGDLPRQRSKIRAGRRHQDITSEQFDTGIVRNQFIIQHRQYGDGKARSWCFRTEVINYYAADGLAVRQ